MDRSTVRSRRDLDPFGGVADNSLPRHDGHVLAALHGVVADNRRRRDARICVDSLPSVAGFGDRGELLARLLGQETALDHRCWRSSRLYQLALLSGDKVYVKRAAEVGANGLTD